MYAYAFTYVFMYTLHVRTYMNMYMRSVCTYDYYIHTHMYVHTVNPFFPDTLGPERTVLIIA